MLDAPETAQILLSAGLMILLQNIALCLWKTDYRTVYTAYSGATINIGGALIGVARLVAFLIALG